MLEFVKGRLVVHHGKDITVMTNEPTLEEQLANLKRYKLFGGSLSMPGDIDPMSRFVRASSYLKTLPKPADTREAVGQLAGIARNVSVPFGALDTSGGEATDTCPPVGARSSTSPTRSSMCCPSTARTCSGWNSASSTPIRRKSWP